MNLFYLIEITVKTRQAKLQAKLNLKQFYNLDHSDVCLKS